VDDVGLHSAAKMRRNSAMRVKELSVSLESFHERDIYAPGMFRYANIAELV
jgi:hypothetical protein